MPWSILDTRPLTGSLPFSDAKGSSCECDMRCEMAFIGMLRTAMLDGDIN